MPLKLLWRKQPGEADVVVSLSLPTSQFWFIFQIPPAWLQLCTFTYSSHPYCGVGFPSLLPLFLKTLPQAWGLRFCLVQIVWASTPTWADSAESSIPPWFPTDKPSASGPSNRKLAWPDASWVPEWPHHWALVKGARTLECTGRSLIPES